MYNGITRYPFARHLKFNPQKMQSFPRFSLFCFQYSVQKNLNICLTKGKVHEIILAEYKFCFKLHVESVSCSVVSDLREIDFVKPVVHLCLKTSTKLISSPSFQLLFLNPRLRLGP